MAVLDILQEVAPLLARLPPAPDACLVHTSTFAVTSSGTAFSVLALVSGWIYPYGKLTPQITSFEQEKIRNYVNEKTHLHACHGLCQAPPRAGSLQWLLIIVFS